MDSSLTSMPLLEGIKAKETRLKSIQDLNELNLQWKEIEKLTVTAKSSLKNAEPWLSRNVILDNDISCIGAVKEFMDSSLTSMPLLEGIKAKKGALKSIEELNALNQIWKEKYPKFDQLNKRAESLLKRVEFWRQHHPAVDIGIFIQRLEDLFSSSLTQPRFKRPFFMQNLEAEIDELETDFHTEFESIDQ